MSIVEAPLSSSSTEVSRRVGFSREAFATLAVSVFCVGAVAFAELLSPGLSLFVPVLAISLYVRSALRRERTANGVSAAADQAYFLGYLCTIAALCTLGVKGWQDPGALENPQTVGLLAGVALLSTVAGLIAMTTLKAHARAIGGLEPSAPDLGGALDKLLLAISVADIPAAVRQLVSDLRQGPEGLAALRQTADHAREAIRLVTGDIRGATDQATRHLAEITEHFRGTATQAGEAVNHLTGELRGAAGEASECLGVVVKRFRDAGDELPAFGGRVEEAGDRVRTLSEAVNQVEQSLSAFVRLVNSKIDHDLAKLGGRY